MKNDTDPKTYPIGDYVRRHRNNRDRLEVYLPAGRKAEIKAAADGDSMTEFLAALTSPDALRRVEFHFETNSLDEEVDRALERLRHPTAAEIGAFVWPALDCCGGVRDADIDCAYLIETAAGLWAEAQPSIIAADENAESMISAKLITN